MATRKRKSGVDKKRYGFSTRDAYYDYRLAYPKSRTRVDRKTWNKVVDNIIDKIMTEVIADNQIYKPKGRWGRFQIKKFESNNPNYYNMRKLLAKTGGFWFYLNWDNMTAKRQHLKNGRLYEVKISGEFRKRLKNHVLKLADDPYSRDYNAPFTKLHKGDL